MEKYDEFVCEARVRFRGRDLALDKIISRINLDEIVPMQGPANPFDYNLYQQNAERRKRFIDMVASEFAHALTQALYSEECR